MEEDVEIFSNTTLTDLFKEIHESTNVKHELILSTIKDLREYIDSADKVMMFAPIIKDYVDVLIRCDEQHLKLAQIIQRIISAKSYSSATSSNDGIGLTAEERDDLIRMANKELNDELNILENKTKIITASTPKQIS